MEMSASRRLLILSCLVNLLLTPTLVLAASVSGTTTQPSVVWVSDGSVATPSEASVHNQNREFVPDLLVIRAGTSVRFPNDDPFFHSIYSSSFPDPFDIGYYGFGPGKLVDFPHAGIVELHCHIHARMHGIIVVTDGPNSGGLTTHFKLDGVLAGTHRLYYWNSGSGLRSTTVTIGKADRGYDLGALP